MLWDMTPSLFSFGRNRRETVTSDDVREGSALVASPPAETTAVAVEAPAPPVPEPSSPRSQAVEDALAAWREELVDLGGAIQRWLVAHLFSSEMLSACRETAILSV